MRVHYQTYDYGVRHAFAMKVGKRFHAAAVVGRRLTVTRRALALTTLRAAIPRLMLPRDRLTIIRRRR